MVYISKEDIDDANVVLHFICMAGGIGDTKARQWTVKDVYFHSIQNENKTKNNARAVCEYHEKWVLLAITKRKKKIQSTNTNP
jgi:hypothetical protein